MSETFLARGASIESGSSFLQSTNWQGAVTEQNSELHQEIPLQVGQQVFLRTLQDLFLPYKTYLVNQCSESYLQTVNYVCFHAPGLLLIQNLVSQSLAEAYHG